MGVKIVYEKEGIGISDTIFAVKSNIISKQNARVFEEQPPAPEPQPAVAPLRPQPEEAPQNAAGQLADTQPAESTPAAAASELRLAAPAGYDEILSDEDFGSADWDIGDPFDDQATTPHTVPQPPQQSSAPAEPGLDFESVLAAELSDDLAIDPLAEETAGDPPAAEPAPPEPEPAPEVQGETKASRDSLEAEMERLLGELSKKS